ncbi:glycosyltransferase family 2 protein [Flavobacterium xinjiangense]|uniref:Glycosyltransferase, GT2 family n=1 Tax=Flavobacterium xinjiangense TaxID=178356 RepID=A0A1M7MWG1_9FLAO|nr:glycosyltransferase [Flavobacterium xinjiangense]SHM95401.1 Glycosyltransferase, GT2 family [Flavobacterium xinjiangense]
MEASVLIVSKNRRNELNQTLEVLSRILDLSSHEVLVFLDGCSDDSDLLKDKHNWVKWYSTKKSIGASAARHMLYPKAQGQILIGLDDDAHPLSSNFIDQTKAVFQKYTKVGIIAFQEIKGVYSSDNKVLNKIESNKEEYYCNEFKGCGFAIRKDVYETINGFPLWIDIYGEESCVSIEVIAKGYDIIYTNTIKINHRIDLEDRKMKGHNYFRFGKQLKNSTYYFLVYYPYPLLNVFKLYWHNFKKYALKDIKYFKVFFMIMLEVIFSLPKILKYRKPVKVDLIIKMRQLSQLKF